MKDKVRAITLIEILIAFIVLIIAILPIFMLYNQNTTDVKKQKELMITLYITKRIMETVRQFNANSPDNFDLLESKFNISNQKVVDNFSPGEFFYYFEDHQNPAGFTDEVGIRESEYPHIYEALKLYRYDVSVMNYEHSYAYDNFYGTGTTSVTLKEVTVKVKDPHKKEFVYKMLLTRARR